MFTYRIEGEEQLEQLIAKLPGVFDTRAILDEGAAVLFNRMRTRFLQETDPSGHTWPQSQAARDRALRGRGGGTLFDTGKLFYSLQLYADSPNTRAIGTNVTNEAGFPYGIVHQYGLNGLPVRQFLGFNEEEDVPYMVTLVATRIAERMAEALGY